MAAAGRGCNLRCFSHDGKNCSCLPTIVLMPNFWHFAWQRLVISGLVWESWPLSDASNCTREAIVMTKISPPQPEKAAGRSLCKGEVTHLCIVRTDFWRFSIFQLPTLINFYRNVLLRITKCKATFPRKYKHLDASCREEDHLLKIFPWFLSWLGSTRSCVWANSLCVFHLQLIFWH